MSLVLKNEDCPTDYEELTLGQWKGTNIGCKFEDDFYIGGTFRVCAEYNGETKLILNYKIVLIEQIK